VPAPPKPFDPGPPRPLPEPVELASQPSPGDARKRENIPDELLRKAGGRDPQQAPSELVAILGGEQGRTQRVLAGLSVPTAISAWRAIASRHRLHAGGPLRATANLDGAVYVLRLAERGVVPPAN
jgi:hypothetical protein